MSNIFFNPERSIRRYATYQLAMCLLVFTVVVLQPAATVYASYATLLLTLFTLFGWVPLAAFAHGTLRQQEVVYCLGTVAILNVALMSFVVIDIFIDRGGLFMAIKAFLFIANMLSIGVLFSYCYSRPADYIRTAIMWFNVTLIVLMVISLFP